MKISIAMATYNGARFLEEQLASLANQSLLPDELVIVDDLSQDNTISLAESFRECAPFTVRIYQNPTNLGFVSNFSRVLSHCKGDLVFLCDQDDVWFPQKLETIARLSEAKTNVHLFLCDAEITDQTLTSTGATKLSQLIAAGLGSDYLIMGTCIAIRQELLRLLLPIPTFAKSHDAWLVYFSKLIRVTYIHQYPLQFYRQHTSNASPFYVNRPDRLTARVVLFNRVRQIAKSIFVGDFLEYDIEFLEAINQRLHDSRDDFEKLIGFDRFEMVSTSLQCESSHKRFRLSLRRKTIIGGLAHIARYFFNGGYRQDSGWKSALKDASQLLVKN